MSDNIALLELKRRREALVKIEAMKRIRLTQAGYSPPEFGEIREPQVERIRVENENPFAQDEDQLLPAKNNL